jgi:hypothetical protein
MVIPQARTRLHDALARLINGQMTNDEFDELYYVEWIESPDGAVCTQIGTRQACEPLARDIPFLGKSELVLVR